jgi:spore maturation protein CgeB
MDLIIVGNEGGTNVGASLQRAAGELGLTSRLCDARSASSGPRVAATLSWRLLGHRPLHLDRFSRSVVELCRREKPSALVSTGLAPLTTGDLAEIGEMGIQRINYSTDDPWNPGFRSRWFLDALRMYDRVFTVRRSNVADLAGHGCRMVQYLPFGYDESLWVAPKHPETESSGAADVFFAGAADKYRIQYIRELLNNGIRVALAGDYWRRLPDLRKCALGHLSGPQLRDYTRSVPISLCLVRRANRDGHVMRSFEIPAIGACMLAEDTEEHREIFGEDGCAVRYFRSPKEAAKIAKELLNDSAARRRLARTAHAMIVGSDNSYLDRLSSMLQGIGFIGVDRTSAAATACSGEPRLT